MNFSYLQKRKSLSDILALFHPCDHLALYDFLDERKGKNKRQVIEIAHPDFRDGLKEEYEKMKKEFYKN